MGPKRALWTAVVVGAGISAFAAPSGVAAPVRRRPLLLTGFLQLGRTDVGRNEVLEFRFSVPLRADSVNPRTLMVNELRADGEWPAVGARIVAGNVVRFDPRRTQRNYDDARLPDSTVLEPDHVFGFPAHTTFVVQLRTGADVTTLRAKSGVRLARAFSTSFGTGDRYDDPVPGQPSFIGDRGSGLIGFFPPRDGATGFVSEGAVLVFEFSEPVLPSSMRLGDTVIVSTSSGVPLAGTLSPDLQNPSGRRYVFAPTDGWPGGNANVGVRITTGVTDLAGNALKRPF